MNLVILLSQVVLFVSGSHAADQVFTTYYHNDVLGSPVAATDQNGDLKWREEYLPYGERYLQEYSSTGNSRWYTGHVHDQETELTYMGARYYDPVIGRFMGVDPVGFDEANIHSFNRYAYANNNPYKYVDPDGRYSIGVGGYVTPNESRETLNQAEAVIARGEKVALAMGLVAGGVLPAIGYGGKLLLGNVAKGVDTRVGRWMHPDELAKMKSTGTVQEGSGGLTFVANSGASSFRKQAKPGRIYVEFDVSANSLLQGGKADWFKTLGPNAPKSQLFKLNKQGGEVNPPFRNLSDVIETK